MKNTERKKFVIIRTGHVVEPAWIVEREATHMRSGKETRMWMSDQMTRKGVPDERKPSQGVGLTKWRKDGLISGIYVPFNMTVEQGAVPLRAEISRLESELATAKTKLLEYYASIPGNLDVPKMTDIP